MHALAVFLAATGLVFWVYLLFKWACRGAELLGKRVRESQDRIVAEAAAQATTAEAQARILATLDGATTHGQRLRRMRRLSDDLAAAAADIRNHPPGDTAAGAAMVQARLSRSEAEAELARQRGLAEAEAAELTGRQ
jgi:hypothetical protein